MIKAPPALRAAACLVAYDPGTRNPGVAVFRRAPFETWRFDGPWLLDACFDPKPRGGVASACFAVWSAIVDVAQVMPAYSIFVAEYPIPLPGRRSAAGDIADLRTTVDRLAGDRDRWAQVVKVKPSEWKGQVPKPIAHGRYEKALSDLEISRAWAAAGPDARDAVGIGLWATGRYPAR